MKHLFLFLSVFISFSIIAQDEVRLIEPIVESPSMNLNQARAFSQFQTFKNWGIKKLELQNIMNEYSGKDVKICICDTGVPSHNDLKSSIKASKNFTSSASAKDNNGHSTHVAGIINEIATESDLYFAKVLNDAGIGSNAWVAASLDWCTEMKADIINLSLGGSQPSATVKAAIDRAILQDVLIIAAAGNEGQSDTENKIGYPARYEETIAVGSVNDHLHVSLFSSSGDEGDLVAPGEKILSTWKNNEYIVLSGTSMATPYISAVAALFIEKYGKTKAAEMIFESTSTDILPEGFDRYSFYGHVTPIKLFLPDSIGDQPDTPQEPVPDAPEDDPKDDPSSWWSENWKVFTGVAVFILIVFAMIGITNSRTQNIEE